MVLYDEREAPLLDDPVGGVLLDDPVGGPLLDDPVGGVLLGYDPVGGVLLGSVDLPDAAQTLPSYLGSIAPSVVVAWNAAAVVVVVVVAWNAATAADDDVLGADQTTHAANYTWGRRKYQIYSLSCSFPCAFSLFYCLVGYFSQSHLTPYRI